jgi:hypothetical protein
LTNAWLPIADVVSLHVPLLPSTYHIMNKPRCVLVELLNFSIGTFNCDQRLTGEVADGVSLHVPLSGQAALNRPHHEQAEMHIQLQVV